MGPTSSFYVLVLEARRWEKILDVSVAANLTSNPKSRREFSTVRVSLAG